MKIQKVGIRPERGFAHIVDDDGDISRTRDNVSFQKVCKCGIQKQKGYFYFVDPQGDISALDEHDPRAKDMMDIRDGLFIKQIESEERRKLQEKELRRAIRRKIIKEEFLGATQSPREPIPEEVQHEVWRRDSGKCVKCGSQEKLEFDHIIPVSKGGSNTARNIQILCEKCNREKSDNI